MTLAWAALLMGLVGNLHCLGMCGPLALAIPIKQHSSQARLFSVLLYNSGRILVYAVFGAVFGLISQFITLSGFQQTISIFLGTAIVLSVLVPWLTKGRTLLKSSVFSGLGNLKNTFRTLLKTRSYSAIFTLGILNGLLPCGLVYMALAAAVVSGTWYMGASYMALFGLGTLPVMFALPYLGQFLNENLKRRFRKLLPITMLLFGLLLIIRGSNLGIPYLSPKIDSNQSLEHVHCH
ncbi:MAG: sulfite exporter TauE/SafE family protein [Flavobacteriales bacterium]